MTLKKKYIYKNDDNSFTFCSASLGFILRTVPRGLEFHFNVYCTLLSTAQRRSDWLLVCLQLTGGRSISK